MSIYDNPLARLALRGGGGGIDIDPATALRNIVMSGFPTLPSPGAYELCMTLDRSTLCVLSDSVTFANSNYFVDIGHIRAGSFVVDRSIQSTADTMILMEASSTDPEPVVVYIRYKPGTEPGRITLSCPSCVELSVGDLMRNRCKLTVTDYSYSKLMSIILSAVHYETLTGSPTSKRGFNQLNSLIVVSGRDGKPISLSGDCSGAFCSCGSLLLVGKCVTSSATSLQYLFDGSNNLIGSIDLDVRSASGLQKVLSPKKLNGAKLRGLSGSVSLSSFLPGSNYNTSNPCRFAHLSLTSNPDNPWTGSNIGLNNNMLSEDAITDIFEFVPVIDDGTYSINISDNPGADGIKQSTLNIAIGKGWAVVGATNIVDDVSPRYKITLEPGLEYNSATDYQYLYLSPTPDYVPVEQETGPNGTIDTIPDMWVAYADHDAPDAMYVSGIPGDAKTTGYYWEYPYDDPVKPSGALRTGDILDHDVVFRARWGIIP